jgi:hypothetical protein
LAIHGNVKFVLVYRSGNRAAAEAAVASASEEDAETIHLEYLYTVLTILSGKVERESRLEIVRIR